MMCGVLSHASAGYNREFVVNQEGVGKQKILVDYMM